MAREIRAGASAAVLCWAFKRAFIAALPVLFFSTNVMIILVIVGYGSVAGILVQASA